MTVQCALCGEEWPRDPVYEAPCPTLARQATVRCIPTCDAPPAQGSLFG